MRILGIDYGSKRIGLALSDPTHTIARSLEVIERKEEVVEDLERIGEIARENDIESIVIGMPVRMSGVEGEKAREVNDFISSMEKVINVPIIKWDERLTTAEGERVLISADVSRRKRKKVIDKIAASLILQNYLDWKNR